MKYVLTKNYYYNGKASRTSYGIALMEDAEEMPGVIDAFVDLSDDKEAVAAFVEVCNEKKLEASMLADEIDAFLK